MRINSVRFLRLTIYVIGLFILLLSIFWLPYVSNDLAVNNPEYAYLRFPLLFGIYLTVIPFLIALKQGLNLLKQIDKLKAFSEAAVNAINMIKYCALVIMIIYLVGIIFLLIQSALHPGIALIGLMIIFASVIIFTFAAVLQNLLNNALTIKSENDLTI
ncbi:DUF2975 domain-containing protein [Piscibacillus halophilus]|nr:DUF2975 domain-containing protein [Piscibacillus halophilus]